MIDFQKKYNLQVLGDKGIPVLFANGYGCNSTMWRFVTPHFQDNFRLYLYDHIGSGNSDFSQYSDEKYNNLQAFADDMVEILKYIGEPAILVCHSVSAMIGALVSIKSPDFVHSLIMVCPSPRYINDVDYRGGFERSDIEELMDSLDSNYLGWASFITPIIVNNPDKPEFSQELENSFCRNNPEFAKHFARITFFSDNRNDLKNIKVPTYILQCSSDIIAPDSVGEYTHKQIQNSQFIHLEATGHCPHLTHPDEIVKILKNIFP